MADEEPGTSENNEHPDAKKAKEKKHDTGAADLDKVTDFFEEKEVSLPQESTNLDALTRVEPAAPVTKITIKKEDVELIMRELDVSKSVADRKLREHKGNVKAAIKDLLGLP